MERDTTPEEVASLVSFLASEEASMITGRPAANALLIFFLTFKNSISGQTVSRELLFLSSLCWELNFHRFRSTVECILTSRHRSAQANLIDLRNICPTDTTEKNNEMT